MAEPERPDVQALRGELERLTVSFDGLASPDGRIGAQAFQRALELRSEFVANHLFRQFDLDGNGTILREHAPERVEVFMCGPLALTRELRPLCGRLGMGFHHEVF